MPKRIVICCDGTWNSTEQKHPTNVLHMARAIAPQSADGTPQVVFYDSGVGTEAGYGILGRLQKIISGATGRGLDKNIEDAYRFLMLNYGEGDSVYLIGFSRGAYAVRSLAGVIRNIGLLHKVHAARYDKGYELYRTRNREFHPDATGSQEFRSLYSREIDVHFIGIWETVGALGIPVKGFNLLTRGRYRFHDLKLTSRVRHAYHALSIDDKRVAYHPPLWEGDSKPGQDVEQAWFAGVHTDVGGGQPEHNLSDCAFEWIREKAEAWGLEFNGSYLEQFIDAQYDGERHFNDWGWRIIGLESREIGSTPTEAVHRCAIQRYEDKELGYNPIKLGSYIDIGSPKIASGGPCLPVEAEPEPGQP